MEKYGLNELRKMFLDFYASKEGFIKMDSAPLIPHNDKSLLLINSGMAPLKPYFTGQETPPSTRVTTCQKCIRTPDIENVGKTARHGTFFEMLGNFSFGDYFKREAITWAWEFLTTVVKIPRDLLYVTVYQDDDEAVELWKEIAGLEEKRIVRMGKEDNFWEIGTGPCGPCSEIYVDRGEKYGCGKPDCYVGCDCDRYVEVWNLVFTQFDKDDDGNYNRLAHPNIDTGMGLERLAVVCKGEDNLFEVDTIRYVLDYICSLANVNYHENEKNDVSIRVITDHVRSTTFMLGDGVLPSNEGRGYVLRRLLRRAVRHGKLLGIQGNFLVKVAEKVIETSGEAYPELISHKDSILRIIEVEETRFNETIDQGSNLLSEIIAKVKADGTNKISGEDAFKLYDTFGFPIDLTKEICEEQNIEVDEEGFTQAMAVQKATSKEAYRKQGIGGWKDELAEIVKGMKATEFTGYDDLNGEGKVVCLISNFASVDSVSEGEDFMFVTDQTPFYAQMGGQAGDIGTFESATCSGIITDTVKAGDKFVHTAKLENGQMNNGDVVTLHVDAYNRHDSERNHTATHLLHKALKMVLGDHVNQAGSEVNPSKLRFDFSHFEKMTDEQLREVENIVNNEILKAEDVNWYYADIDEAKKAGATALFGEKYGKNVRVVKVEDFSMELCGGCHIKNTGMIGAFVITSEAGSAAGVRRIEALTGHKAIEYINSQMDTLKKAAGILKTTPDKLIEKVEEVNANVSKLTKELNAVKEANQADAAKGLLDGVKEVNGTKVLVVNKADADMNDLRTLADKLRDELTSGVVFIASSKDGKGFMLCAATKDVVAKGFNAGNVVKSTAGAIGAKGGGRPDMAQAGFPEAGLVAKALEEAEKFIIETL